MNSLNPKSSAIGESSSSSSSSSSVPLPQAPALSSFADRQCQRVALDRINGSLFFYPFEPENSLLNRLFSMQDLQLLFNLFHEYKVSDDLAWIDLLGLRCFDLLKQIENILRHEGILTEKWCPLYLLGYVSLFYKPEGNFAKDGKFFITPISFAKRLNELSNLFDNAFAGLLLEQKILGREQFRERTQALIQEWKKMSVLFGKFLMLPRSNTRLFTETISGCIGSEKLIPASKEEKKQAVDHLLLLMRLHQEAFDFGAKSGTLTLNIPRLELSQKIDDIRKHWANSFQEELLAKGSSFFEELFRWRGDLHNANSRNEKDLNEATSGKLNHEMWRAREGIVTSRKPFSQPDFIERTTQSVLLGKLLVGFACDYHGIFENCILQASDHNSVARAKRFKHVANSILELSFEGKPDLLEIRGRFEEKLRELFSLSYIQKFLAVADGASSHVNLIVFEFQGINKAFLKLQEEIDIFLAQLGSEKMKADSLSHTELNFWAQAFVLLHDLRILTHRGPVSSLESEIFPNRFLELFESMEEEQYFSSEEEESSIQALEELPTIAQLNVSSSSTSQSEQLVLASPLIDSVPILEPVPMPVSSAVERTKQAQESLKSSRKDRKKEKEKAKEILAERESRKVEQMLHELETSPAMDEQLKGILEEKKRLKVERILKDMGLEPLPTKLRGKGDHKIWRDPQNRWGQTVIPEHSELREGTRHAIVEQLLNKKNPDVQIRK